jgi:hypothetical protein
MARPMQNKCGRSFVTIMIAVASLALFLRIAIEQVMRISILRNQADASSSLKLISTALENYAQDNQNVFPDRLDALSKTTPAYLERDYATLTAFKGYLYSCPRLDNLGYRCIAVPAKCGITGKTVYVVTTGGSLTQESCLKKE